MARDVMEKRRGSLVDPLDVVEGDRDRLFRGDFPKQINHGIEQPAPVSWRGRRAGSGSSMPRSAQSCEPRGARTIPRSRSIHRPYGRIASGSKPRAPKAIPPADFMSRAMASRRWLFPIPASPVTSRTFGVCACTVSATARRTRAYSACRRRCQARTGNGIALLRRWPRRRDGAGIGDRLQRLARLEQHLGRWGAQFRFKNAASALVVTVRFLVSPDARKQAHDRRVPRFAARICDRESARIRQGIVRLVLKAFDERTEHGEPQSADGLALGHAPFLIEIADRQIEPVEKLAAKQRARRSSGRPSTPWQRPRQASSAPTRDRRRHFRSRCRPSDDPPPVRLRSAGAAAESCSDTIAVRRAGRRARPRKDRRAVRGDVPARWRSDNRAARVSSARPATPARFHRSDRAATRRAGELARMSAIISGSVKFQCRFPRWLQRAGHSTAHDDRTEIRRRPHGGAT